MTLSPWLIYFADLASPIDTLFIVCTVLISLVTVLCFSVAMDNPKEHHIWLPFKLSFSAFCLFGLLALFTPSTNTVYKMMIVPPVVNSDIVQKLPDELQKYIDKVLSTKDDK
jgi:hypothetical protein